ncbi:MAG: hypothetical protein ACOC58_00305 [Chloroflexota bacterium]
MIEVAEAVSLPCTDRSGKPILDKDGNPMNITFYRPKRTVIYEAEVLRLYDLKAEEIIAYWQADDRAQRAAEWRALERALHSLAEVKPERGEWNATAKDVFFAAQPPYYIEGLGISGLTFKPFAKVRVASTPIRLFVEIGEALKGVSRNRRRKARRYGKALPKVAQGKVESACWQAVRHFRG